MVQNPLRVGVIKKTAPLVQNPLRVGVIKKTALMVQNPLRVGVIKKRRPWLAGTPHYVFFRLMRHKSRQSLLQKKLQVDIVMLFLKPFFIGIAIQKYIEDIESCNFCYCIE